MKTAELKARTTAFSVRIIRLVAALPRTMVAQVLGRQALRSGTSAGANYREAIRATSRADFLAKVKIVERELEETLYWLELIEAAGLMTAARLTSLRQEADELLAIFVAIAKTTRTRSEQIVNRKS